MRSPNWGFRIDLKTVTRYREMPNLEIKTEGQVLKDKIALLNSTSNSDVPSLIIVLEELEDLAHKVSHLAFTF